MLEATKCLILESSFFKILNITALSWQNKYINHFKTLCVFYKNVPTLKSNWNFLNLHLAIKTAACQPGSFKMLFLREDSYW